MISDESYNPNDYDSDVEIFNPSGKISGNLWGVFEPTWYQYEWHEYFCPRDANGKLLGDRHGYALSHRRSGKTVSLIIGIIVPHMIERGGTYIHAFPDQETARRVVWNGVGKISRDPNAKPISYLELIPKELWLKKDNVRMELTLKNGAKYRLIGVKGSDGTANHLRGLNCEGLIADEYPIWLEGVYGKIFQPILKQSKGFSFLIGTPWNLGEAYERFERYNRMENRKTWHLTIEDTYYNNGEQIVDPEEVAREVEIGEISREDADREFYCKWVTTGGGTFYGDIVSELRSSGFIVEGSLDCLGDHYFCGMDIGQGDDQSVLCVYSASRIDDSFEVRLHKEYRFNRKPIGYMLDRVERDYRISCWFLPHDAKRKQDKIDRLESRVETLRAMGYEVRVIPKASERIKQINLAKEVLPRCRISRTGCNQLVNDLMNYKRERNRHGVYTDKAVHDKHSHGADCYRVIAMSVKLYEKDVLDNLFIKRREMARDLPTHSFHHTLGKCV